MTYNTSLAKELKPKHVKALKILKEAGPLKSSELATLLRVHPQYLNNITRFLRSNHFVRAIPTKAKKGNDYIVWKLTSLGYAKLKEDRIV